MIRRIDILIMRYQPFNESSSATLIVRLLRNSVTRMARPIAASAAGHGQDEEHEHLAGRVTEEAREGDEIGIDREQQQLDAHQQHDHVLAVDDDAGRRSRQNSRAPRIR
jgi:hypothetical protein